MNTSTENLQRLHQSAGDPSFRSIERQLVLRFGDLVPSAETLRLYHNGQVKKPDTAVLGMLAWYYGVDTSEIDDHAGRVLVLLGGGLSDPRKPNGEGPGASVATRP